MAVLSKTFETTSDQHSSLKREMSLMYNKLFIKTFPDAILQLKTSCSLSSCWEIQYLFPHYLHRDLALRDLNTSRMAVLVFQSLAKYFKMIDLKYIKVIQHLAIFKTAITSLCIRDKCTWKQTTVELCLLAITKSRDSHALVMKVISVYQGGGETEQLN